MVKPVKKKRKKKCLSDSTELLPAWFGPVIQDFKKYTYKTSYKTCSQPLLLHLPINTHSLNSLLG